MTVELRSEIPPTPALVDLYAAVQWTIYARDPDGLETAFANSTHVVAAWQGEQLVGVARCLSDDVSIAYLQDILVRPSHQGAGLGTRLMQACLARFDHVRQFVLLTDDRPDQLGFYAKHGFANTRTLTRTKLNAFVRIAGVELA